MTIRSGLEENIEFVGRQLSFMAEREDFDVDEALRLIEKDSSEDVSTAASYIRSALKDHASIGESHYKMMFKIVESSEVSNVKLGGVISYFTSVSQRIRDDSNLYIYSLRNTLSYSAALIALATCVMLVFNFRILPGFEIMFSESGADLPEFTGFMMGGGLYATMLLMAVFALMLLTVFLGVTAVKKKVRSFQIIPASSFWSRIGYGLVQAINSYIVLAYLSLYKRAGCDDASAIEKVLQLIQEKPDPENLERYLCKDVYKKMRASERLGTLSQEIDHQLNVACSSLADQFIRFRSGLNIGIQTIAFIVIGALVVSYYLPIFSLGAAI